MVTKFIGDYSRPVPFPDTAQSKNYKWFKNAAYHLFHLYQTGRMSIGYGGLCLRTKRPIRLKRDYYFNTQDITPLREKLDPLDPKTKTRVYNIDWSPVDFHAKTLNNAAAKITQLNYVPKTTAIDEASMQRKNVKANKAKLMANPEIKQISQLVGYKDEDDLGLDDTNDADALQDLDAFRLNAEINLKNAVEHSLIDSKFKLNLQDMFIRDKICDNRMVASVEINPNTGRPHVKYIDIANAFYSPSIFPDANDMTAWGYTEQMTIPQLRTWFEREKVKGKDSGTKYADIEKVLLDVSKKYTGYSDANTMSFDIMNGSLQRYYAVNGYYPYDHYTVRVATFGFIASDTQAYVQGVNEDGVFTYEKTKANATLSDEDSKSKSIDKTTTQNVYKVRWVVGTDYIFDYGLDDAIAREGEKGYKKAIPNFVVYQNAQTSLIDRIIPKIDQINIFEFKERQIISKMIPQPAMKVDLALLEQNITLGGVTYNMKELIDFFEKRGILFYRSTGEFNEDLGSQRDPVEFMKTPEVSQLIELAQKKAMLIQEVKDLIGVNDIADGTQTSAELAVGVNQMSIQAVNNALSPNITGWRQFCTNIGKLLMRQYETLLAAGKEINGVYFDEQVRKEYKLSGEILSDKAEYAFTMELAPTYEEKQLMMQAITSASQKGVLSISEMTLAMTLIINDDIKAAQYYMSKIEKRKEEQAHQRQMELTTGQAQAQGDATVKAEEAKLNNTIMTDNNRHKNDMERDERLHRYKLTELSAQHGNSIEKSDNDAHNKIASDTASLTLQNQMQPTT